MTNESIPISNQETIGRITLNLGTTRIVNSSPPKLYFWDWSQTPEEGGFRFENLVASQLLKYCHFIEDTEGYRMELRFLRDTDRREVDFVVLKERKPLFAVECKTGERMVSPAISYFKARTPIPRFYQVHLGTRDYIHPASGTRVLPFRSFCVELGLFTVNGG